MENNTRDSKVLKYQRKQPISGDAPEGQFPEFLKLALLAGLAAFFSVAAQELTKITER